MYFRSLNGNSSKVNFETALKKGLADDGGLFLPKSLTKFSKEELNSMSKLNYQDLASKIIFPFIGDFMSEKELSAIIQKLKKTERLKKCKR